MKKYNSPIFEIEMLMTSDVVTTSGIDKFKNFASSNVGNLDDGSNVDVVEW